MGTAAAVRLPVDAPAAGGPCAQPPFTPSFLAVLSTAPLASRAYGHRRGIPAPGGRARRRRAVCRTPARRGPARRRGTAPLPDLVAALPGRARAALPDRDLGDRL